MSVTYNPHFRSLHACCLTLLLLASGNAGAEADVEVSVRETGAVGDGVTDDTAAFQTAISRAAASGRDVKVTKGRYRITRTLTLKAQALTGQSAGAWNADEVSLPVIVPDVKEGPCFRLLAGGSIHGVHVAYDWGAAGPRPSPPAVEIAGVGCRVSEVKMSSPWVGIAADGKSNVGRALVEKCFLVDVHNVGILMTGTWDVSWISKVEVWSPNSKSFPKSGVGFLLGKNDLLLLSDCFAFNAKVGYRLNDSLPECTIKGTTWGSFSNCTADFCGLGVEIEGAHTVSLAGGTFWTHFGGMVIRGDAAQVRVAGLESAANGGPALSIEGGRLVAVAGCQLRRKHTGFEAPSLKITGGGSIAVTGCVIESSGRAVEIADGLKDVALSGNVVKDNCKDAGSK